MVSLWTGRNIQSESTSPRRVTPNKQGGGCGPAPTSSRGCFEYAFGRAEARPIAPMAPTRSWTHAATPTASCFIDRARVCAGPNAFPSVTDRTRARRVGLEPHHADPSKHGGSAAVGDEHKRLGGWCGNRRCRSMPAFKVAWSVASPPVHAGGFFLYRPRRARSAAICQLRERTDEPSRHPDAFRN
jgi:hypothetical protein